MKFKVGDTVLVTGGKDKGKQAAIIRVLPREDRVVVKGVNRYVKHIKPIQGRAGSKASIERALPTAKVAIINDKGQQDRIGYTVAKDGTKTRVFKKSGAVVPEPKKSK
jgi:large subunit ribosomal protein L24